MKRVAPRTILVLAAVLLAVGLTTSYVAAGGSAKDQARATAASGAYAAFEARFKSGAGTADGVYVWSVRWLDSEKKTKTPLTAAQAHLARMRTLQANVKAAVAAGTASTADQSGAAYYVAEAEVWVSEAGGVP
jgi:hypothetical protein